MDLLEYLVKGSLDFSVASMPLVMVFLQLRIFKHPIKEIVVSLSLFLAVSIYFWVNLKNLSLTLYQIAPYISGYIWLGAEHVLKKKQ